MTRQKEVPEDRVRPINDGVLRPERSFVLYWMTANRRTSWNFALDRALEHARRLNRPLVVLEALRCDYQWASDRFHRFVIQGMADNARAFEGSSVHYHPYIEPKPGAGKGLLRALARQACVIVSDDSPNFFLPRMQVAAAKQVDILMESVDSNGLLPMQATQRVFSRAYDFRRFLQKELAPYLEKTPRQRPLARLELPELKELPRGITRRWGRASSRLLRATTALLAGLPIDHSVGVVDRDGGQVAAEQALHTFLEQSLEAYGESRNQPDSLGTSGLSSFLHFGHISTHQILAGLASQEGWSADRVGGTKNGARLGWWGMEENTESYLDQLVTWRELGANFARNRTDIECYESLPAWALETLEQHSKDIRPHLYSLDDFDSSATHDQVWNAAQNELSESGQIQGYLRMLWGKKILHWSPHPRSARDVMVELNNRYALDGRDFNSSSGIFWVLGRYDRAWGPERQVFGKVRYMSSKNTRRKLRLDQYLSTWTRPGETQASFIS